MSRILFFTIIFLYPLLSISQSGQHYTREDAEADILSLSEGVLVVRLQGEKRKLEALSDMLEKRRASERPSIERRIQDIREERDSFNLNLIQAFRNEFGFCPVYFIYDHDARRFLDGERSNIFLGPEGNIDPSIEWSDKPYLGLRSGEAKGGPEGLIMMDERFNDLPDPFPGFITKNSIGSIFNWLLAREIYWSNNAKRMVRKLDEKLTRFADKAKN